jgi:hypothetical protein
MLGGVFAGPPHCATRSSPPIVIADVGFNVPFHREVEIALASMPAPS